MHANTSIDVDRFSDDYTPLEHVSLDPSACQLSVAASTTSFHYRTSWTYLGYYLQWGWCMFTLEVPTSYFVFPSFSLHTFHDYQYLEKDFCTWETVVIGSSAWSYDHAINTDSVPNLHMDYILDTV